MKKFELTNESISVLGKKLYRIKALISFSNVKKGELGGYVEKEENLSQHNDAWIYDDACAYDDAWICDDAVVCDDARIYGNACACDDAWIGGNALMYGNANARDDALIRNRYDILSVSYIGSRFCTTTFFGTKEGIIGVSCGCFSGTIDEFEKAVNEKHQGSIYEKQYKLAIDLAKVSINRRKETHHD